MGSAKRRQEEFDDARNRGTEILIEEGVLSRCEHHEEIVTDNWDDSRLSKAQDRFAAEMAGKFTREECDEFLDSIIKDAPNDCPLCEKFEAE